MKLIVGLGNPGKQYDRTRHNAGFIMIDKILSGESAGLLTYSDKLQAAVGKTTLFGKRVILAKPTTFMNNSGVAIAAILNYYRLTPDDLILIHDDKDVPLGEIKVQKDRGPAGHNGVASTIEHLGTKNFLRVRLGIAPDHQIENTASFVLSKFTKTEQKILDQSISNSLDEIKKVL